MGLVESLQEILGRKDFRPPDEVSMVIEYIKRRYKSSCRVRIERDAMIIKLPNSALAATVQMERQALIDSCRINRRLVIGFGR